MSWESSATCQIWGYEGADCAWALRAGTYTNAFDVGLNIKNGFPVFTTVIDANYINKQEDRFAAFKLTDEDKQELHRLARDPRIGARPLAHHTPPPMAWSCD